MKCACTGGYREKRNLWRFLAYSEKRKNEIGEEARRLVKNEIRMEPDETVKSVRADGSKIGGKPWLPADFEWPVFVSKDDGVSRPLSFFCQIDLAEKRFENAWFSLQCG